MQSDNGRIAIPQLPEHIGIVVKDIEKAIEFFCSTYNTGRVQVVGEYSPGKKDLIAGEPFKLKIATIELGAMTLELLQPVGEQESPWSKFLESNGEGLHHIAYRVSNVEEVISKLKERGIGILIGGYFNNRVGKWAYMNTGKNPGGVTIEVMDYSVSEG